MGIVPKYPRELGTPDELTPLSKFRLLCATFSYLGVQFGWGLRILFTTPIFSSLGVPSLWLSVVWAVGPIVGFLVMPLAGTFSDNLTSSWGRRRPVILFGSLTIIIAMIIVSNAQWVGEYFGDDEDTRPRGIATALIGFWIFDLSLNAIQGPCRAILVDIAPESQQNSGNSLYSALMGAGQLAAYGLGAMNLVDYMPYFGNNVRAVFTLGIAIILLSSLVTIFGTKEYPLTATKSKNGNPFKSIISGMKSMPSAMWRICLFQLIAWVAWFEYQIYISAWVGEDVYSGDASAKDGSELKENYDEGVRWTSLCLAVNAAVVLVYSLILPFLIKITNLKFMYGFGQLIVAIACGVTLKIQTKWAALGVISAIGIPWATTMAIPYIIVSRVAGKDAGRFMGVYNFFVVLPQLIVALSSGAVVENFGDGDVTAALAVACGFALLSIPAIGFLKTGGKEETEEEDSSDKGVDEQTPLINE